MSIVPHSMARFALAALTLIASLASGPARAGAQGQPGGRCELEFVQTPTTRVTAQRIGESQQYNSFIGGGVNARCEGQDVRLLADSAEAYGATNVIYLIGKVRYTEPRVKVDANRMTYFQNDERLLMEGNVVAVLPSGTTMRGPQADYYRAVAGVRPRTRLVAPGRPTVTLVEKDTTGKRGEPTRIVANLITMDGDSLVYASGAVEITRTDIEARGDSAFMDSGREFARLMRQPRIVGKQKRPFTLEGAVIDLYSRRRQLERVLSMVGARATSEDLKLDSDTIDMRMSGDTVDNTIERVYVWGKSRARATSPERDILADSLDVRMPRQRIKEVHAVGGAFAQIVPDTTRIRNTTDRDWLRGDTIVAYFDTARAPTRGPASPRDTVARARPNQPAAARATTPLTSTAAASPGGPTTPAATTSNPADRPRLQRLEAIVEARAFYQAANEKGPDEPPSLCYSRGQQIVLTFADNEAQRVTVRRGADEVADGVCLEPGADSTTTGAPASRPGDRASPASTASPSRRPATSPVRRP